MKPGDASRRRMSLTSAKSKMFEFGVPQKDHIDVRQPLEELLPLAIGQLGDLASAVNRGVDDDELSQLRMDALFGAQFLEELDGSKEFESASALLLLFAAAANYLAGLPGNARVLATQVGEISQNGWDGLAQHLHWLLLGGNSSMAWAPDDEDEAALAGKNLVSFFDTGHGQQLANEEYERVRARVYESGGAEDLLLGDIVAAVAKTMMANSSWTLLPFYSGLPAGSWAETIAKPGFMKELWPSQQTLGKQEVLRGRSAILQLPTGAGKTRAAELIIRSSFLSGRSDFAIVVAPFRALCHEIRLDLAAAFEGEAVVVHSVSDVLQADVSMTDESNTLQIMVLTPEKLAFMLRADPQLASRVGLAIFDEAHQFDSGSRGVLYELLLSSLRVELGPHVQRILISAVIGNAGAIGDWFLPDSYVEISGFAARSARTSLAFTSWKGNTGRINYVETAHLAEPFFVPRVIERQVLGRLKGERVDRHFPSLPNEAAYRRDIALFLAMSLSSSGAVAVYCASKSSVRALSSRVSELKRREINLPFPRDSGDQTEVENLARLIAMNLGEGAEWSGALEGVLPHHGEVPGGVRLAIEHALRKGLVKCVISTSTLAQGVNLPLKYLVVSSFSLGAERLSTRDFQNLMGRVSRPGMHTEGSVIIADPAVFELRKSGTGSFGWKEAMRLTAPEKVEDCSSSLLELLRPINVGTAEIDGAVLLESHLRGGVQLVDWIESTVDRELSHDETLVVLKRLELIATVENFILARSNYSDVSPSQIASALAASTLAYSLSDERGRDELIKALVSISAAIEMRIPEAAKRHAFASSMYGAFDSETMLSWLWANIDQLTATKSTSELARFLWPLFESRTKSAPFRKCTNMSAMKAVMGEWLAGGDYSRMCSILNESGAKIWAPKVPSQYSVGHAVSIGEGAFAYEASMIVGTVKALIPLLHLPSSSSLEKDLDLLQRELKYGLPQGLPLQLFELGFADRSIAMQLSELISGHGDTISARAALVATRSEVEIYLSDLPHYYRELGTMLLG